jgi:disulfide bond formation protein DsbB
VGLVGSLLLSLALGLKACPLCFYQRTFVMAAFAILAVGLATERSRAGLFCLLCVPLAFGGLGVAAFHEYLVLTDKLECPLGLLGLGTAPAQSLAAFVLLSAVTVVGAWVGRRGQFCCGGAVLGASVLGLLLAWASVASAPPMPTRDKPYDPVKEPLNICRPPFHA